MSAANAVEATKVVLSLSARDRVPACTEKLKAIAAYAEAMVPYVRDPALRKRVEVFHNKTNGLRHGVASLDYTFTDVAKYRIKALSFLREIEPILLLSPGKVAALQRALSGEEAEETETAAGTESDRKLDYVFKGSEAKLAQNSAFSGIIRTLRDKDFVVHRAPIIPMFNPTLMPDKLAKLGLGGDTIGGYAVVDDQIVMGLNFEYIKTAGATTRLSPQGLVDVLVSQMEKKSKRKLLSFAGQPKGPGRWWWIVESRTFDQIRATGMGGHPKLSTWGFAFS